MGILNLKDKLQAGLFDLFSSFSQVHRGRCAERDAVGRRAAQSRGQRGTPRHQRRPAEAGEHRFLGTALAQHIPAFGTVFCGTELII